MMTMQTASGWLGWSTMWRRSRAAVGCGIVALLLGAWLDAGRATAASVPLFHTPGTVSPFGLTNVFDYSAPAIADLDDDGDVDFLVGDGQGNTSYFENTGSATAPAFAAPVVNAFGLAAVNQNAAPAFGDLDGDGDLDLLVGDMDGDLAFFRNTGTAVAPAFAAPAENPFGLTNVGGYAAPTLVDIDADGDLDAFVGNNLGDTYFFRNTGTALAPAFAPAVINPFGLVKVSYTAVPIFVDIYGTGVLSVFIGDGDGRLHFFENLGSATAPAFGTPIINPFGLTENLGSHYAPLFVDIDADGYLDAFIGNFAGYIFFFAGGPRVAPAPAMSAWALVAALLLLAGIAAIALSRSARQAG